MNLELDELVEYAKSFIGLPYRWGGSNPMTGFDCSGLAIELLKAAGVITHKEFDTTAQGLFDYLRKKLIGDEVPSGTRGAFVFFGSSRTGISHVGFCVNKNYMIEAGAGDSSVRRKEDAEIKSAFIRLRPINSRKDVIGFVLPNY